MINKQNKSEVYILIDNKWEELSKMNEHERKSAELEIKRSMYGHTMKISHIFVNKNSKIRFGGWNLARRLNNTSLEVEVLCKDLGLDLIGITETGQRDK